MNERTPIRIRIVAPIGIQVRLIVPAVEINNIVGLNVVYFPPSTKTSLWFHLDKFGVIIVFYTDHESISSLSDHKEKNTEYPKKYHALSATKVAKIPVI